MKALPILYNRKEDCCGCTACYAVCPACYAVCPAEAIFMLEDEEGFEYPKVNVERCQCCYLCLKVCPIKKAKT